jgi:L-lysine exporter family protein LysE/ArgO
VPLSTILSTALLGFGTGLALIVAIGAQNAYVLRIGLLGRTRLTVPVVLVCALSDAVLIAAGVAGIGAVVETAPQVVTAVRVVGAGFLLVYAVFAARRALRPSGEALTADVDAGVAVVAAESAHADLPRAGVRARGRVPDDPPSATDARPRGETRATGTRHRAGTGATTTRAAVLTAVAFTWLNPHVYLDTLVFLGSVANQQPGDLRWWWAAGAVTGSVVWFSALGLGSRLLRPLFARPGAWRVLDGVIAVVMAALGVKLLVGG